jgi:hypothetical protein
LCTYLLEPKNWLIVTVAGVGWHAGYLLVALLGWSRVTVKDHTVAQVVAGCVLGAGAAALAYAALVPLSSWAAAGSASSR